MRIEDRILQFIGSLPSEGSGLILLSEAWANATADERKEFFEAHRSEFEELLA